jgi:regulator of sigma E protease
MDILIFIVALSILVLVHEFGHYFASKFCGVKIEEFGLGLPPRIWGKQIGETLWSLNWLPIGGFCKMEGENPADAEAMAGKPDSQKKSRSSFMYKKPWQKALIVLGGVLMNLILAVVIFATVYTILGVPKETNQVKIISVVKDSPADKAGLKENDVVVMVNQTVVKKPSELTTEVGKFKGKNVQLRIKNYELGIEEVKMVQVRENPPAGEGSMGIAISNTEMVKIKWYEFYKGIGAGFKEAYFWGKIIFEGMIKMIGGLAMGQVPKDVAGPIGMFEATSSINKNQGLLAVIHFFGIVSVNLAVVNVLPFPALDGGRIIFVIYEMITRKRANEKFEAIVNNVGMMVLLSLILLITVGDVMRIVRR